MREPRVLERSFIERDHYDYLPPKGQGKPGKMRGALPEDCKDLIDHSLILRDPDLGEVKLVYLELDDDHADIVRMLRRIQYQKEDRMSGMAGFQKTFGYRPRNVQHHDWCSPSKLAREDGEANDCIMSYAAKVGRYYEQFYPELYAEHQQRMAEVLPDWKMKDTVFTSGIVNRNNPLPYHVDGGNLRNVWSNMLVFKNNCDGGYLSVPEYDVCFELKDNSLLMFDGQNLLHGVTPFKRHSYRHPEYWRYSVVFYSRQSMWQCLPPDEELHRIRKVRTEREGKRPKPVPIDAKLAEKLGRRQKSRNLLIATPDDPEVDYAAAAEVVESREDAIMVEEE